MVTVRVKGWPAITEAGGFQLAQEALSAACAPVGKTNKEKAKTAIAPIKKKHFFNTGLNFNTKRLRPIFFILWSIPNLNSGFVGYVEVQTAGKDGL
jgi:hypothetical protein